MSGKCTQTPKRKPGNGTPTMPVRGCDQFSGGSGLNPGPHLETRVPEEPGMATAQDSNKVLSFTKETDVTYQTNLRDG